LVNWDADETTPTRENEFGLTLIELLIVIVALGVLAAIVVFSLGDASAQSTEAACNANAKRVEIAMGTYNVQTGGTPTVTAEALTSGPNPILDSFPTSSSYTITIVNGVEMVASPSTATPVPYDTANPCGNADATNTTTTSPASTTTTIQPPTTTTTAPANPSNGVVVTASSSSDGNGGGQETLSFTNSSAMSALTVTINVVKNKGVTHDSQANTFPTGVLKQGSKTSNGVLVYTSTLKSGKTIPLNSGGTVSAVFNGNGSPHDMFGDTWSVVSTSGGIVSTLNGNF
jgi:general secretion pathway protein G